MEAQSTTQYLNVPYRDEQAPAAGRSPIYSMGRGGDR